MKPPNFVLTGIKPTSKEGSLFQSNSFIWSLIWQAGNSYAHRTMSSQKAVAKYLGGLGGSKIRIKGKFFKQIIRGVGSALQDLDGMIKFIRESIKRSDFDNILLKKEEEQFDEEEFLGKLNEFQTFILNNKGFIILKK